MAGMYADNKAAQIGVTTTLSILVVTNLIGNTLVILIILTNRSMKSPMYYLLVNLAVADIIVGLFFSPQYIFRQLFTHPEGLAGSLMCKLITGGSIAWVGGVASVVFLVAISFERYFAVLQPYSSKLKLNVQKAKRIIVACWICAVIMLIPNFLFLQYDKSVGLCTQEWPKQHSWLSRAYGTLWLILFGVIPVTTMFVLYSRVIYTLWFKRSQRRVQSTQLAMLKSRKRVTKMVVIVSIVYVCCWMPDNVIYLLYQYDFNYSYAVDVPSICGIVLIACNSAINPFIYTFQSERFRRHLKELVCCRKLRRLRLSVGFERYSLNIVHETRSQTTNTKTAEHSSNPQPSEQTV